MKYILALAIASLLTLSACANSQSCPGGYASTTWCHAPTGGLNDSN